MWIIHNKIENQPAMEDRRCIIPTYYTILEESSNEKKNANKKFTGANHVTPEKREES